CRDRQSGRARCPCHPLGRSSWLALVDPPRRAGKHHHHCAAAKMPRAQSDRKCLAVHARQLALEPSLQILRRSRRPLLRRLEQAGRSALAHHVHWAASMGPTVLHKGDWYKTHQRAMAGGLFLKRASASRLSGEGTTMISMCSLTAAVVGRIMLELLGSCHYGHTKAIIARAWVHHR